MNGPAILRLISKHPEGLSVSMMAKQSGMSWEAIKYHVSRLRAAGKLQAFIRMSESSVIRYRIRGKP